MTLKKLPSLDLPVYTLTLPTTGQKVKYQPFTRDQEKAILIAQQEDNFSALIATMTNLLKNCCDTEITNMVDFAYVSAHIRAKSHGEAQKYSLSECECGHKKIDIKIDNILDQLRVVNKENLEDTYKLRDMLTLKLIPLKTTVFDRISVDESVENMIEQMDVILAGSIAYILQEVDGKREIHKDFTYEELQTNILSSLTQAEIEEIQKKISNLISVFYEITYTCPECKETFTKEISDFLL